MSFAVDDSIIEMHFYGVQGGNEMLTIKEKLANGSIVETELGDKANFEKYVLEAYSRRKTVNKLADHDEIVKLLANGCTIKKADYSILKRSLRHYDEVYLCNEIFDILEESESVEITLADKFEFPTDLSKFKV